jgi:hypothetical protein
VGNLENPFLNWRSGIFFSFLKHNTNFPEIFVLSALMVEIFSLYVLVFQYYSSFHLLLWKRLLAPFEMLWRIYTLLLRSALTLL